MLVTFKQFTCYLSQQENSVGLSKIISCIYQIDLLPSQIDGGTFFVKILIYSVGFPPQDIL